MDKKLLFAAFIFIFIGIKAQTNRDRKLLLEGFDESKVRKELKQKGLDSEDYIVIMRRRYMTKRAKELGLLDKLKTEHASTKVASEPKVTNHTSINVRNGNNNTVFSSACPNSSFQQLNFSGWSGDTATNVAGTWTIPPSYGAGILTYVSHPINSPLTEGGPQNVSYSSITGNQIPSTNRHNIMNAPPVNNNPASPLFSGYDSLAINQTTHLSDIPFVSPSGSGTSLRLGNANSGAETEGITYSITVTSSTTLFTYQYAVVLNNPNGSHTPDELPYFNITTKDQYGNPLDSTTSCGTYSVSTLQASTDSTFKYTVLPPAPPEYDSIYIYYKKWTSVSVDLTHYIGQTVSITFQTYDCSLGLHFGYAYIDAYCGSPSSASSVTGLCGTTAGSITMVAPPGFSTYQWYGPNPNYTTIATGTGANTQSLTTTAAINDTFVVKATSPSGCLSSFKVVVQQSSILVNTSSVGTCLGGLGGSVTANAGAGSFSYSWNNGALGTNTVVTGLPPGSYTCIVTDQTHQCLTDTVVVGILGVNPALQNATVNFCGSMTTLTAPTSFSSTPYAWYNSSNTLMGVITQTNTISGAATGQHYTVIYLDSATHCEDSLKIKLNEVNLTYNVSPGNPCTIGGTNGYLNYTNTSPTNYSNSYNWIVSGATSTSGTVTSTSPINLTNLGTGTYTMIITAPGNTTCTDIVVYTLTTTTVVATNIDSSYAVCNMDTLKIINTIPNVNHQWSTGSPNPIVGSTTVDSIMVYPSFTNAVVGFYKYIDYMTTIVGNCLSINEYVIKIKSFKPSNITSAEPLKCYNDATGNLKIRVLSEKNGPINTPDKYTFTWSSANPINSVNPTYGIGLSSSSICNLKAGTYTCEIANGNCIEDATYTLANGPLLPTDSIYGYYCPKDSLGWLVANTGYINYVWHPSNTGASVTGDSIHVTVATINNYYVTYTSGGCADTAKIMIPVTTHNVFAPNEMVNVFSPNGDTRNDVFYPFYQKNISQYEISKQSNNNVYELKIYDRWGILVFETTDYSTPWNGKTKSGHDADAGTYFFYVTYESNCATNADKATKKGFVELVR